MNNTKLVKQYLNKYFKEQYINENDSEFKALLKMLNNKDKVVKNNCDLPVVVFSEAELSCATCKHEETMPLYICCDCVNYAKHELAT